MPYKDKKRYRDYMAAYMRQQRKQARALKQQIAKDTRKIEQLRKQFPQIYELLYGKKKGRK